MSNTWHTNKGPVSGDDLFDLAGFIPAFLDHPGTHKARENLDYHYQHGGGWRPMKGFKLSASDGLSYSDDSVMFPLCWTQFGDEKVMVYPHAWVVIKQPNGSFEVARMD